MGSITNHKKACLLNVSCPSNTSNTAWNVQAQVRLICTLKYITLGVLGK
ncbi:hypothetical protein BH18THE2_BH18THE2_11520 [soil metagenome]